MQLILITIIVFICSISSILAQELGYTIELNPNWGYLNSIKINNNEFLANNTVATYPSLLFHAPAPGTSFINKYMHIAGMQQTSKVTKKDNKIISTCDGIGQIEYILENNAFAMNITNTAANPILYHLFLKEDILGLNNNNIENIPITKHINGKYSFVMDNSYIEISGEYSLWGPFKRQQMLEVEIKQGETKSLTFKTGILNKETYQMVLANQIITRDENKINLSSPKNYQVFQRSSKYNGTILFTGNVPKNTENLYYKIIGKGINNKKYPNIWEEIKIDKTSKSFSKSVPAYAGGWYTIEIKAEQDNKIIDTVTIEKVGIGEVFIGAGQSNSSNCGEFTTKQESGMVSCTDGINWQYADDPMIGCHDTSPGGSFYPALGDRLYNEFKVPIGIASTAHGGTTLDQWMPNSELYKWTMKRILQMGKNGFRAILWHQGESDYYSSTEDYVNKLKTIIKSSNYDAGWTFPWFVAQASYLNYNLLTSDNVRKAQKILWETNIALQGPDTDILLGDNRDRGGYGVHFSPKGLKAHGNMWADLLIPYIHKSID